MTSGKALFGGFLASAVLLLGGCATFSRSVAPTLQEEIDQVILAISQLPDLDFLAVLLGYPQDRVHRQATHALPVLVLVVGLSNSMRFSFIKGTVARVIVLVMCPIMATTPSCISS